METPPTGTEYFGNLPMGTHVCEFHSTQQQLADTLIPYFAAGLEQGELCTWITSDPRGPEAAKAGLMAAAPFMEEYFNLGQIEIWHSDDWYLRGGRFDADRVLGQWVEKEKHSRDGGYKGLRASGDVSWINKKDWPSFMDYEGEINRWLPQHRVIGLCTYTLDGSTADQLLDVVRTHQIAVTRTGGEWETIDSSRFEKAVDWRTRPANIAAPQSERLQRLLVHVLENQDAGRKWYAAQLHEVTAQNITAIAKYIDMAQQKRSCPSDVELILAKCQTLCEESIKQVLTLSHLLHPMILDQVGLAPALRRYIQEFIGRTHIQIDFQRSPQIDRLPLEVELHLFRVAQEGLLNIQRHSGSQNGIVRLNRTANLVTLQITDFGRGLPGAPTTVLPGAAAGGGTGILAMQERLRKIGGSLEIRSTNQGTTLTASLKCRSSCMAIEARSDGRM